jgi:hypothetical protein
MSIFLKVRRRNATKKRGNMSATSDKMIPYHHHSHSSPNKASLQRKNGKDVIKERKPLRKRHQSNNVTQGSDGEDSITTSAMREAQMLTTTTEISNTHATWIVGNEPVVVENEEVTPEAKPAAAYSRKGFPFFSFI